MEVSEKLEQIIAPIAESFGCVLWGIDYRSFKLSALVRVYIDKTEGITLDDCSNVSRQVSAAMDVEDPIDVPYTLEVSSPGTERLLLKKAHYEEFIGQQVKLRLKWRVEGQRNIAGQLLKVETDTLHISSDDEVFEVPLEAIARGRLLLDVEGGGKDE